MSTILEIPKKIYVNALAIAGIPTAASIKADVRRQEVNGDVEYTLIDSLWKKPTEAPKKYPAEILIRSDYGERTRLDYEVESRRYESREDFMEDWGTCTNAMAWCYIKDILPKGGRR